MLAQFQSVQRSPKEAEETLLELTQQWPESTDLLLSLGNMYESTDRLEEAITNYNKLIKVAPTSSDGLKARNRLVAIKVQQNKPDEARQLISEILIDDPTNISGLLARAAFLYVEGKYDEVIADARVIVSKEPDSEDGLLFIARAHREKGDQILAQDAYRRVIAVNPNNTSAVMELSTILVSRGEGREAEKILQQLQKTKRQDAKVSAALIQALLVQNNLDAAEAEARRLIELDASSAIGVLPAWPGNVRTIRP